MSRYAKPDVMIDRLSGVKMKVTFTVGTSLSLRIRMWIAVALIRVAARLVGIQYVDARE